MNKKLNNPHQPELSINYVRLSLRTQGEWERPGSISVKLKSHFIGQIFFYSYLEAGLSFGKLCVNMGCFMFLTFQLNFKSCHFFLSSNLYLTSNAHTHFLWAKEVSIPKVFYQARLLFFWECCSQDASGEFGKPECGRPILETLSLLSHSGPCEQLQGLTPGWASVIGDLEKKCWSGRDGGQKSPCHKQVRCPITFLPQLLFPASPPGLLGSVCCLLGSGSSEAGSENGAGPQKVGRAGCFLPQSKLQVYVEI